MTMRLDASSFLSRTNLALRLEPKFAAVMLTGGAGMLKKDADEIEPKTPHLEGNLRGNFEIKMLSEYVAILQFNMPYAAKWHEAADPEPNWSESGIGPKYVESKLIRFPTKYSEFMARRHKELLEAS